MKKVISFVLVICLTIGLFSGCSFKRISAEEDIINMQVGGYLYTSRTPSDTRSERNCLSKRQSAVKDFISVVEETANKAFALTSAIIKYEDNILKYIDKAAQRTRLRKNKLDDVIPYCHTFDLTRVIPILKNNHLEALETSPD